MGNYILILKHCIYLFECTVMLLRYLGSNFLPFLHPDKIYFIQKTWSRAGIFNAHFTIVMLDQLVKYGYGVDDMSTEPSSVSSELALASSYALLF